MTENQFETISRKLDTLIYLLAAREAADKTKREAILMLYRCGLDNQQIENLTGASKQTIYNYLSEARSTNKSNHTDKKTSKAT